MKPLITAFRHILSGCLVFTMGVSFSTPLVYSTTADRILTAVQKNYSVLGVENRVLPPDIDGVMPAVPMAGDPPIANDDSLTVLEGGTAIELDGGNDSVLDNDFEDDIYEFLTASIDTPPAHGNLTLYLEGTFRYTHDGSETTRDSFRYVADDGQLADFAKVTITINPVNDPPIAVEDSFIALEDTELTVEAPGVLLNDSDAEEDPLTANLFPESTHDDLTLNDDGSFSYMPPQDFVGVAQFTYRADDGADHSNVVTLTITVQEVDDEPPFISWISPAIGEDTWIDVGTQIYPLEVEVLDNVRVASVRFRRWEPTTSEWVLIGSVNSAPFRFDLDTSTLNIGFTQITAEAIDTNGNRSEAYIFLRRWGSLIYLPVVSR